MKGPDAAATGAAEAAEWESGLTERHETGAQRPDAAPGTIPGDAEHSEALLALALDSLDQDKAEEVVSIDLRGKSSIADHMIIASGRSGRQVAAMADKLAERVKARFGRTPRVEGKESGDWTLLDCGDVIVHLFRPEVREFYQLEKMWQSPAETRAASAS